MWLAGGGGGATISSTNLSHGEGLLHDFHYDSIFISFYDNQGLEVQCFFNPVGWMVGRMHVPTNTCSSWWMKDRCTMDPVKSRSAGTSGVTMVMLPPTPILVCGSTSSICTWDPLSRSGVLWLTREETVTLVDDLLVRGTG